MAGVAAAALLAAQDIRAADVNITANRTTGFNLDTQVGATVDVAPGVSVSNAVGQATLTATTSAWALTNRGTISGQLALAVSLPVLGSSVDNQGSITSTSGAVQLAGGGSVTNRAGATITAATNGISIGTNVAGPGSVDNAGTITQTGTLGDLVLLRFGGMITNSGTIAANNTSNAASVGNGASRTVINTGTITNTGTGFAAGVLVQGGASTVTNAAPGRISGTYNGVYASSSAALTLMNSGLIASTGANVNSRAVEATAGGTITNSGTIQSASGEGIYAGRDATVTNRGTITGATRAINFAGNFTRTLNLDTGSVLNGNVQGGTGTDGLVLLGTGTEKIVKFLSFETLSMQGSEWQLSGAGAFSTSATIQSGTLGVNGTLTSPTVSVGAGGTLTGTGRVVGALTNAGVVRVAAGSTFSLTGPFVNQAGSFFAVGLTPAASGRFAITGPATLNGGTVRVEAAPGAYPLTSSYTILTATGGVGGQFAGATSTYAFLAPSLTYMPNAVLLTLVRNSLDFSGLGRTRNQIATAAGINGLTGGPIFDALIQQDAAGARAAFDDLSGEIHASLKGALTEETRYLRDAVLARARLDPEAGASLPAFAYASMASLPVNATGGPAGGLWGQSFGAWGQTGGDGNAARLSRSTGGFVLGADVTLDGPWRIGAAGGYSRLSLDVDARNASASADTVHAAVYAAGRLGALGARVGAAYSHSDISTNRAVLFPGFSDATRADYGADTAQVFGELGYRVQAAWIQLEPFAAFAFVSRRTDGFTEAGGAAALSVRGDTGTTGYSTLGVHASAPIRFDTTTATVRASLGWRHASDDTLPLSTGVIAGGAPFTVAGVPIARDALAAEAAFDIDLSPTIKAGIAYRGQIAEDTADHALKGRFAWTF